MSETIKEKAARKQAQLKKQRNEKALFGAIVLVVLGIAGFLLFKSFYKPPLPVADNVIDVSADMSGFSMTEIRVKVGQPVTIRLRSLDNSHHTDGAGKHQWAVDDFNVSVIAPAEGTATTTFTPTKTGTYVFYCDICCGGRANPSMNGKLIVEG
ncbi:MAG: cupredoxin domain-containing protein [Deltaproteobacteria bacterium]|nr:cupredoxin domain-containing protein [Deltaproteobacteria bacterium]